MYTLVAITFYNDFHHLFQYKGRPLVEYQGQSLLAAYTVAGLGYTLHIVCYWGRSRCAEACQGKSHDQVTYVCAQVT